MKHTKLSTRLLAMLLAMLMAFSVVPTGALAEGGEGGDPTVIAVTGVTLSQEALELTVGGESAALTATVDPAEATNQNVTWASDNSDVATVENGVVTAKAAGNANITVTTEDGSKTATCAVTVAEATPETVAVESVSLDKAELSLTVGGESATLAATVDPAEATDKTITWSSDNVSVATVESGVVTAVGPGSATITATAGGKSATCTVTVSESQPTPPCGSCPEQANHLCQQQNDSCGFDGCQHTSHAE